MQIQGPPSSQPHPVFILSMNIINTITHLLLGAVAIGAILIGNVIPSGNAFQQHIYLCVIGYIVLMAQAVLSMNPYNSWSNILPKQDKELAHWVMQILGSILAIAGSILRMTDRNIMNHFRTAHGILGLVALIFTILSLIGGVLNIYSARLQLNVTFVKICHACIGCMVLLTAFLSIIFAFNDVYRIVFGNANATMMISLTVAALIGTIMSAMMTTCNRIANNRFR